MRSTRRASAAWWGAVLVVGALGGCTTDHQAQADETALRILGWNVDSAVSCLQDVAPELRADLGSDALADALTACGGTTFFNHDDDTIRDVDRLDSFRGTIVVSGSIAGSRLSLELLTSGAGLSESGVSRARALVATCWQVEVDLASHTVGEPGPATCNDAVVEEKNPSEVVPFDEVTWDRTG